MRIPVNISHVHVGSSMCRIGLYSRWVATRIPSSARFLQHNLTLFQLLQAHDEGVPARSLIFILRPRHGAVLFRSAH